MNRHAEILSMGMGDQDASESNLLNLFMDITKKIDKKEEDEEKKTGE